MPTHSFEYSIIRVVPRVEREEFLNAGVVVSCPQEDFLQARIDLDRKRFQTFAPATDADAILEHLQVIPLLCAGGVAGGPIGLLPQRARFHWLVAPRSSVIQFSPVHSGLCEKAEDALERIFAKSVLV